jgi:hypothetical protein
MNKIILIAQVVFGIALNSIGQSDTLFIKPWVNGHAVYMLPPGKLQVNDVWTSSDSIYYPPVPAFRKFDFNLKETYLPLYVYQGKLVYYDPCDGIFESAWVFNDSALVHLYYDGPEGSPIAAMEYANATEIQFRILQFNYEEIEKSIEYYLTVKSMNKEKGIYLFTFEDPYDAESKYSFPVVERCKLHLFHTLVCDCLADKHTEFQWEVEPFIPDLFK